MAMVPAPLPGAALRGTVDWVMGEGEGEGESPAVVVAERVMLLVKLFVGCSVLLFACSLFIIVD